LHTAPFIAFAVFAVAYLKATGAKKLVAKVFQGSPVRMVFMAALVGGMAPFCSCEVIPFIAAMLALGAPLGAVMAFWLAAPLMDLAMFAITSGTLGWEFALAKTVAAVGLGIFGGFATMAASRTALFASPCGSGPAQTATAARQNPMRARQYGGSGARRTAAPPSAQLRWKTVSS